MAVIDAETTTIGGRAGGVVAEIRWFVPGRLPRAARTSRPDQVRTDEYYLPSLAADFALKRRRGGPVERKWRLEPPLPVLYRGRAATVEQWLKERLVAEIDPGDPADWIPVQKRVWRKEQVQVAEVAVADTRWWTLAVHTTGSCFPELPVALLDLLSVVAEHPCQSYPAWLLDRTKPG
jgi:hypothetical protein